MSTGTDFVSMPEQVVAAVEGLARDGFVNYFGLQRFGSGMSATHK